MVRNVFLKAIDPIVEEEVTIVVDGIELVGFVSYCPYAIEAGKTYLASIDITVLNDFEIKEIDQPVKEFQHIGSGFAYYIRGILRPGGILDSGITIQDELLVDYAYLYNKYVEIQVDRIAISFEKA
jgi:hypothetical protein